MITNTYLTEQVAAAYRREAEQAAQAHRLARAVRTGRSQRTAPNFVTAATPNSPVTTVRFPRPRRWFAAVAASVR